MFGLCSVGTFRAVSVGCVVLVASALAAHSQVMPNDSDAWRARCAQYLDAGSIPAPDASGITAERYEQLARDRSGRNQHFVACNLYLSAAAAQSAMGQTQPATTDLNMAKLERKIALGQKLSFADKLTRASAAMIAASKPAAPPNGLEAMAVNMLLMPGGAPGMMPGGMPMQQGVGMQQSMGMQTMQGGPQGGGGMTLGMTPGAPQGQGVAMGGVPQGAMPMGGVSNNLQGQMVAQGQPATGGMTLGMTGDATQGQGAPIMGAVQPGGATLDPAASAGSAAMTTGPAMPAAGSAAPVGTTGGATVSGAAGGRRTGTRRTSSAAQPASASAAAPAGGSGGGSYSLPPVGRYTCYAGGMSVLANGMGYNPMTIHVAGFNGYMYIRDRTHYSGTDGRDTGTYVMNGNELVPQSGPYKRVPAALHYLADGQYHRPTMYVQWLDDNGKPMSAGSMICTWDGPAK